MWTRVRAVIPEGGTLPDDVWRARHAGILVVLWLHAVFIPLFALARGFSPLHAIAEGAIVPSAAVLAGSPALGRRARTVVASFGLLSASAVLVHLSGGVIEMHFHFFVMVALVTLYQDWLPFLVAIGYVFVHHGLIGALDATSVFNHFAARNEPWKWAGIHALFITGLSLVCLVTWRLNESLLSERREAAIENARLYEAERAARTAAEAAGARLALLADATRALTSSLELDVMMGDLARLATPTVADVCLIDLVEHDGSLRRAAAAGHPDRTTRADRLRPLPGHDSDPAVQALRSGRPQLVEAEGLWAVAVPLSGRREPLGVLWLVNETAPGFGGDSETVSLAEELARRAAIAVENARLFARQRSVSETLQQSLLPERLPEIPGLATAARYVPGGPDVDVGGDWYDVMQLPGGGIGLAMGDVVGRGERAAALMGQLRNAVRAYAFEGKTPAQVLNCLNGLLLDAGSDHMATMIYGVLDAESGELRMVNAGHPPPLLVEANGDARFLEGGHGPPVGALATAGYDETCTVLTPGATLLLYTDGLVEDRATPLEDGLARLRRAAQNGPRDPDAFCSQVMRGVLVAAPSDDDVALLAVQLIALGDRLQLRVPAVPGVLAPLRATLRRWLVRAGASDAEAYELLTACGEACTNAIRHAIGPARSEFEVEAAVCDGGVEIRVRDRGSWREPRRDVGGRGLPIIEAYVDDLEIVRGPTGTEVRMRRRLTLEQEVVG